MEDGTWRSALSKFTHVIESLKAACTNPVTRAPEGKATRESWLYLASRIENFLPKFVIAFRDCPKAEMCQPLGDILVQYAMDLVAMYQLIAFHSCTALGCLLAARVSHLLQALLALAEAIGAENSAKEAGKEPVAGGVARMFGAVEESCGLLRKCPLDSYRATIMQMAPSTRLIKDALSEVQKMEAWPVVGPEDQVEAAGKEVVEHGDEYWDSEGGEDGESLLPDEAALLQPCVEVLRGCGALLEKVQGMVRLLAPTRLAKTAEINTSGKVDEEEEEDLLAADGLWLSQLLETVKVAQVRCDDLVSTLYDFDAEEVSAAAQELVKGTVAVMEVVRQSGAQERLLSQGCDMEKIFTVVMNISNGAVHKLQEL